MSFTKAALAVFASLCVTTVIADKCHVEGYLYMGDFSVSGAIRLSELLIHYPDGSTYSFDGDDDPNCCNGDPRTTTIQDKLAHPFEYTAMMDPTGTEIKGCTGTYDTEVNIPGAVDVATDEYVVGADLASNCYIEFDC